MNETSELPKSVPEIPRGPLSSTLVIPPAMTFLTNMAIGLSGKGMGDAGLSLFLLPVMFFVVLGFTSRFHHIVGARYRGRSLVFLNFAYFLGQIIVCLALWFGSCVLFFKS